MSLSRLITFAIGVILAIFGLLLVIQHYNDLTTLIVGLVLLVIGVVLLTGKVLTL